MLTDDGAGAAARAGLALTGFAPGEAVGDIVMRTLAAGGFEVLEAPPLAAISNHMLVAVMLGEGEPGATVVDGVLQLTPAVRYRIGEARPGNGGVRLLHRLDG